MVMRVNHRVHTLATDRAQRIAQGRARRGIARIDEHESGTRFEHGDIQPSKSQQLGTRALRLDNEFVRCIRKRRGTRAAIHAVDDTSRGEIAEAADAADCGKQKWSLSIDRRAHCSTNRGIGLRLSERREETKREQER